MESVVNMMNLAVGAGVLSFPYGFQLGGYVWTFGLILCTAAVAIWSLTILIKGCNHYNADSYQTLVRKAGGQKLEVFVVLWLIAFSFGACLAFMASVVSS